MKSAPKTAPLPMTVPMDLYAAMVQAVGQPFTDSYLCGAVVIEKVLRPRTAFARDKLAESKAAMRILAEDYIVLGKPLGAHERTPIA